MAASAHIVLLPSQRYVEHAQADAREEEARRTLRAVLGLDVCPPHKRELLNICLWKLTEARPSSKYALRYRTHAALHGGALRHEHVHQRKHLVAALLAGKEAVEAILARAVACTVTRAEHRRLDAHEDCDGWERYRRAGLRVIDTQAGRELDLHAA
jgi:hypothetical protein